MNCPQCGFAQQVDGRFCNNCGAAMAASFQPPRKSGFATGVLIVLGILVVLCGGGGLLLRMVPQPESRTTLTGNDIASTASPSPTATVPPLSAEELRTLLREDYERTMSAAHTHLNFIKAKLSKTKGGYALMAEHTYFGQYTLKIGGTADVITNWINVNQDELKKAQIVRVGVKNDAGFGGSSWFDVK